MVKGYGGWLRSAWLNLRVAVTAVEVVGCRV